MAPNQPQGYEARTIILHLHNLVTAGPWQLEIAGAMSPHGYDDVKWAEGEAMLAELISSNAPPRAILTAAACWYQEAAAAAQQALAGRPHLLAKLGL
ncbi:MAG: hypothetical protein P8129_03475 [Anaerolineae bacterium]|jgi:hypothetical protein